MSEQKPEVGLTVDRTAPETQYRLAIHRGDRQWTVIDSGTDLAVIESHAEGILMGHTPLQTLGITEPIAKPLRLCISMIRIERRYLTGPWPPPQDVQFMRF